MEIGKSGIIERFYLCLKWRKLLIWESVGIWGKLDARILDSPLRKVTVFHGFPLVARILDKNAVYIYWGRGRLGVPITTLVYLLNAETKRQLWQALQLWAPVSILKPEVVQLLSTDEPPRIPEFTELWMQALRDSRSGNRKSNLKPGDIMHDGQYQIVRQLGTGGQGTAYLAVMQPGREAYPQTSEDNAALSLNLDHIDMAGERVVLKEFILPSNFQISSPGKFVGNFEDEINLLRTIEHPHIVRLKDIFAEDHRVYSVFEYVNGKTLLGAVVDNGHFAENEAIKFAIQMCDILAYLHGLTPPVVHRDFAPDNLIIAKDQQVTLIDFSVAQRVGAISSTAMAGKHAYIAPEQFGGEVCIQSDIYSFGATLFYVLTGIAPEPISQSYLQSQNNSISNAINAIVAKCTAFKVDDRYATIAIVRQELSKLQEASKCG
jgi:hypothetical protein